MTKIKVCIVTTVPFALNVYMKPHIEMLSENYDVTLITSGAPEDVACLLGPNVRFINVKIERKVFFWKDLHSLWSLCKIFRQENFTIVHSLMPKTALLSMLAARLVGVPIRIHTFTGQVWVNRIGISRFFLKLFDKYIAVMATDLLADSFSQRQFLIDQKVMPAKKVSVLGHGSICGVDMNRFRADPERGRELRRSLGIPEDAVVCLFLGRLNRDKGLEDLALAFSLLAKKINNIHLLVVGPDECNMQSVLNVILSTLAMRFHRVDYTSHPEQYMACADLLCIPSYREGFGSVVIEAAAVGIPTVGSNIYGLSDAVIDGVTGLLHPPKDVTALALALETLVLDAQTRQLMGKKARDRVTLYFTSSVLKEAMRIYYKKLLITQFVSVKK